MTNTVPNYPVFGLASPANLLTIARLVAAPFLFWVILQNEDTLGTSWVAFVLGWAMGATDFFDGKVARATGHFSRSGAFLDPLADKIVVIGGAACLASVGRFSWAPVIIIAVREIAISAVRINFVRQGLDMPARTSAKYKTFLQGIVLAAAIFPPLESQMQLFEILMWAVAAFTVFTGLQYLADGRTAAITSR